MGRAGTLLAFLTVLLSAAAHGATAALVIDDLGYNRERARRALALPPPFAVAVLPQAPYSRLVASAAVRSGVELLVHLPMQGHGDQPPRMGLHGGMSDDELRAGLRAALEGVPGAIGMSNHMGSVLTRDRRAMTVLMRALRSSPQGPLVFLDSRTTAETVAESAAVRAGIGTAARDVFLDHDRDPTAIERQLQRWLGRAQRTGCALAIGHPYPETLAVLERLLPRIRGVRRVGLRKYIETCGTPAVPVAVPQVAANAPGPEAPTGR